MAALKDYVMPDGYGTTIGKCLTYGEIEALLAAERERCAKVAEDWAKEASTAMLLQSQCIAAAIRNLPPQTEGDQP